MKQFAVYRLSLFLLLLLVMTGCNRKVGPTRVVVTDPVRHYNPINLGDELEIYYDVTNIGETPFIITDIQPSCGCIAVNANKRMVIYPDNKMTMHFTFKATKNIGYVHHTIRLYGNVAPHGVLPLEFDLNVVPPSGVIPDYEEYVSKNIRYARLNGFSIKEAVDGDLTERDYIIDSLSMAQWMKKYQ